MIRAVFMGSDSFSVPVLGALLERGAAMSPPVTVVGVVTQPDRPAGRGRRMTPGPVKVLAAHAGIPVLQPERIRNADALDQFFALRPDLIVVASFGQLLPRVLLEQPRFGALNLHPSLLPRYRGPAPIVAPILAGDTTTGTTLMLMVPRMDAGPILSQVTYDVDATATAGVLRTRLAHESADLLVRDAPKWIRGEIAPTPQAEQLASYTSLIAKSDALLDWTQDAETLARKVRAYNPWPVAYTTWQGDPLKILEGASVEGQAEPGVVHDSQDDALLVGTGEGLLKISRLQLPGKRPLPVPEAIRGYPALLHARFLPDSP